jgi:hypothetical protein
MTKLAAPLLMLRWLVITVIMVARLAAPAMAMQPPAELAGFLDPGAICHALPDDGGTPAPKPVPHAHDCGLCPACHIAQASVLPALGPVPPMPRHAMVRRVLAPLPPSTAGPQQGWSPSRPRGPPSLRI